MTSDVANATRAPSAVASNIQAPSGAGVNGTARSIRAERRFKRSGWALGFMGAVAALVVWTLLAYALAGGGGAINRLPTPLTVARELYRYAASELLRDLLFSLRVFVIGWVIGAVLATLVGLLLGRVRIIGNIFLPIVEAIRPVSSIAWVPLSIRTASRSSVELIAWPTSRNAFRWSTERVN